MKQAITSYVKDKWVKEEENYLLDFQAFSELHFERGIPEILFDLIFYLTGHLMN